MKTNAALKEAMKIWVEAAVDQIQKKSEFLKEPIDPAAPIKLALSLPECEKALKELKADVQVSSHYSSFIKSAAFSEPFRITAEQTLEMFLNYFVNRFQSPFDSDFFEQVYNFFEKGFYGDRIEYRAVAPISGLAVHILREKTETASMFDDDPKPYDLAPGLILRPLIDNEYKTVHNFELVRRYSFQMSEFIYGICADYSFSKKLIPITPGAPTTNHLTPPSSSRELKIQETNQTLSEVIWILRLFKSGGISNGGIVHYSRNFLTGSNQQFFSNDLAQPFGNFHPYSLTGDEIPDLKILWENFQKIKSVPSQKNLQLGLRRLNYCRSRNDLEDKAIDLMIAAETIAQPPNVGDKSSAIADFYSSYFPVEEIDVKEKMHKLYSLRNSIIHSGSMEKWLKIKSNYGVDPIELIVRAEEYTRIVLLKEISSARTFVSGMS